MPSASARISDRSLGVAARARSRRPLNRLASIDSGGIARQYPVPAVFKIADGPPFALAGSSDLRSRETRPWTTVPAVRGGSSPHSSSMIRAAATGSPAWRIRRASRERARPVGISTRRASSRTSVAPRMPKFIRLPESLARIRPLGLLAR